MHALRSEMSVLRELLNKAVSLISSHEEKLANYAFQVEQLNKRLEEHEKCGVQFNDISRMQDNPTSLSNVTEATVQQPRRKPQPKRQAKKVDNDQESHLSPQLDIPRVEQVQVVSEKQTSDGSDIVVVSQGPSSGAENDHCDGEWTVVKKRNSRQRPSPLCGTADPGTINLKAVEIRKYFHLWNMASGVDDVRQYITHLCPAANISVDELTTRGDYKSYKIGVTDVFYDILYSADVWPVNAKIKPWINYRKRISNTKTNDTANMSSGQPLPFRQPTASQQI
ncbi:hypothetical protein B5X24_HaOG204545 [Helicoverpa armigera]|uniref:Uncharacterized protein n=1 Tax=Helicoverpa armigera TaxID=29058 RepID=A0A2W1BS34_HELAM|nr:hypothetical protein B5X24_HaOG204545 [Helicoverpa armigera]